jgi:hypothetical protein
MPLKQTPENYFKIHDIFVMIVRCSEHSKEKFSEEMQLVGLAMQSRRGRGGSDAKKRGVRSSFLNTKEWVVCVP